MTSQAEMSRPILGETDGFRGRYDTSGEPGKINAETFAGLTMALIDLQHARGFTGDLAVGNDGPNRQGSAELTRGVIKGALARGVNVIYLGTAPTPAIQHVADERRMGALASVSVTASHNDDGDNGWKGMLGNRKPDDTAVAEISRRFWDISEKDGLDLAQLEAHGEVLERQGYVTRKYVGEIVKNIEALYGPRPLADKLFVVDGANGAASVVTPKVFSRLGARVVPFMCNSEGMINDHCGATHLDGVKSFMLSKGASILQDRALIGAVANDGDADRVMAVGVRPGSDTEMADFVDLTGNHEMWALAKDQLGIVGTEYTNSGLTQRLEKAGIGFEPCPNGDRYVTQRLEELQAQRLDWRRGGEFTGHLIDTDWGPSGDGVRAAALYAAHAVAEGKTFADLHEELPLWHEEMRKLPVASKAVRDTLLQQPEVSDRLGEIAAAFQGTCRQIVRASGTELAVRAWVESSNPAAAQHASRLIMNTLLRASRAA